MWTHKNSFAIGGLENVGFAPDKDYLIVLSSQGQGIFDCKTGEKIARQYDKDDDWWDKFNEETNSVLGFDILNNIEIPTYGLYGDDNLPKRTEDGWELICTAPEPDDKPFERYSVQKIYLISPNKKDKIYITKDGPCEHRAFGFSNSGKALIVASSCELVIYSREGIGNPESLIHNNEISNSNEGFWFRISRFFH